MPAGAGFERRFAMKNSFKYTFVFMGGVTAGIGICGVKVITDDDFRESLIQKLSDKVKRWLYGEEKHRTSCRYKDNFWHVDNIVFESRDKAEEVVYSLNDVLDRYGYITVSDLCCEAGLSYNYNNQYFGWTRMNNFKIVKTQKGYELQVPRAISIK